MYTTSTFFIKAQTPGATMPVLIELYRQELEYQHVKQMEVADDAIIFSNESFNIAPNAFGNKFSRFSNGQIHIKDNGIDFLVTLQADMAALFVNGGILAGIVTIFLLIGSGFNLFAFGIGVVTFGLYSLINYIFTVITFPVYFTSVRNDIEQLLQSEVVQ